MIIYDDMLVYYDIRYTIICYGMIYGILSPSRLM